MSIKAYKQEIADGIDIKLSSNSIALQNPIILDVPTQSFKLSLNQNAIKKTTGSENIDLFDMFSILSTVGWNQNDDVFDRDEMWTARHSCDDKPLNLHHNQHEIIGHIIGSNIVDDEMQIIGNSVANDDMKISDVLPERFHILTKSVIYKHWSDATYQEKINQLLAEIQAGEWFVSMECLFSDFDYGIIAADGQQKVIKRDEESSFLTKHLRIYGGTGKYNNYKVGRLMRNIVFSGKGIVKKPANPYSVILNNYSNFNPSIASLVYITSNADSQHKTEKPNMSEDKIVELEKVIAKLTNENKDLATKLADVNVNSQKTRADNLATELDSVKATNVQLASEIAAIKLQLVEATNKNQELVEANKKFLKEQIKTGRISKLVKAGKTLEQAELLVEGFVSVDEDAFDAVVVLATSLPLSSPNNTPSLPVNTGLSPKSYVEKMISMTSKSNAPQVNTTQASDVLDAVVADDQTVNSSVASDKSTKLEETRAQVNSVLSDFLLSKKNK